MIWKNYFDVVILPPRDVRAHAIALSKELRRYGGKFVLGERRYLPHISLYHIPVRPKRFEAFAQAVGRAASLRRGGTLRLRAVDMPVLMTTKPEWLVRLHKNVVESTLPYFDWDYGAENLWNADKLPPHLKAEGKRNLMRFGSPMIGRVFRPHITLSSFDGRSRAGKILLEFERLSFAVNEIAICELGPHHTCHRTIARYAI